MNTPNETLVRTEDVEAAKQLAAEATSTADVATLREMLADDNNGNVTLTAEDGSTVEVKSIGQEKFAELGHQATEAALKNLPANSETWVTEEK